MNATPPRRPVGKPPKVVTDEVRAAEIVEEMRRAGEEIQNAIDHRLRLALEANELGLTTTKMGEALGFSPAAVAKWVRTARERKLLSD